MSIIDDVDAIGARLKELEASKASLVAGAEPVGGKVTVTDEQRANYYGIYGWGYQAPATDVA